MQATTYDRADCIIAIVEVADDLGTRSLTMAEYDEHRSDEHPSARTIQNKLRGWNNAVTEAGLECNTGYTKSDCIDAIKQVASEHDFDELSRDKYDRHRSDRHPSAGTIENYVGSWTDAVSEAGLNPVYGSYTESNCIDAIKQVASEHDLDRISQCKYTELRSDEHPSVGTIQRHVGSWNDAIDGAGLDPSQYTESDCIDAMREVAPEHDAYRLTQVYYRERRSDGQPAVETIRRCVGSWSEACDEAGLESGNRGGLSGSRYTESDCIEALEQVASDRDLEHVSRTTYREHRDQSMPSDNVIIYTFESWSAAQEAAGLELYREGGLEYTIEELLDAVRSVADRLDTVYVSRRQYKQERDPDAEPVYETITERTELTWTEVNEAAGLCPSRHEARQYIWAHGPVAETDCPYDCNPASLRTPNPSFEVRRIQFTAQPPSLPESLPTTILYVPTKHPFRDALLQYLEQTPALWTHGQEYTTTFITRELDGIQANVAETAIESFFEDLSDDQQARIEA